MAKIRAYKLAEELGIDRNEFVEKAAELGIELKSAMAAIEPAQQELLREKLGEKKASVHFDEERVERKGGAAVIRRRKKSAPEPEPVPEPILEAVPAPGPVREVEPAVAREPTLVEAPKPVDPDMDRGCNVKELFKPPIIALAPRPTPTVADAPPPTYFPAKAPAGMSAEGANTNQTICSVFVTSRSTPILVISPL